MENPRFTTSTSVKDGVIVNEVEYHDGVGRTQSLICQSLNTREQHIREALVKLGWTPPEGRGDAGQRLADEFNRQYLKATQTSQPQDYFDAALLGRQLVDMLAEHGVISDCLPELQRESPNDQDKARL